MGHLRGLQALPLLLLLVCAASCHGVQTTVDPTRPPSPTTTVEVKNLKPVDLTLYVRTGTHRLRLGMAPGKTTRFFVIPAHVLGEQNLLRFELDTIGSDRRSFSEEALAVRAGEQISLTIHPANIADGVFPAPAFP